MNVATPIERVKIGRLRAECLHLGIETQGKSRTDLVTDLKNAGLLDVDERFPAKPPKINTSFRRDDLSNVYLGNGAGLHETGSNKLYIANSDTHTPLIGGDFKKNLVTIDRILRLEETYDFEADTPGNEGDIRRHKSNLYVFRCTGVHPGWYPIQFGPVTII